MPTSPVVARCLACLLLVPGFLAPAARAADVPAAIVAKFPEIQADQIRPTPVPGLFEVRIGSKIAYVTGDARYLVQGDIVDLDTDQNLTEARRDGVRRDVLNGLSESSMIIFAPAKYTDTVTVFTDLDCGYCRKLHRQIADYNAKGIRVRYLAFPRTGPGTDSWTKAEKVWCAKDKQAALTKAKSGEAPAGKVCQPNPVAQEYQLGRDFGLTGTPAIVLESGELIGGYLDPDELQQYLAESKAPKAAGTAKNN